ncbi:MAG: sporulation inhibitor of replication protein SirA [Tuberibacillus sp.]
MRYFDIYLIKEDIARLYIGREDLLYRLFLEKKNETDPNQLEILKRQVRYITEPLTLSMRQNLLLNQSVEFFKNKYTLCQKDGSSAAFTFDNRSITLEANGSYSAETAVFEMLRAAYSHFFAVDYQNKCGAWLSPQRRHILHQRRLVL